MCDPVILAAASIAASVIGTGMSMYGQYQQGQAANAAAQHQAQQQEYAAQVARNNANYQAQVAEAQAQQSLYRAQVADNNKTTAEAMGANALERGRVEEARHRLQVSQLSGKQATAMAANGVTLDDGSPLDVLGDTAYFGELDALTIQANSEQEAWKHRMTAANFGADAGAARYQSELDKAGAAFAKQGGQTAYASGMMGVDMTRAGGAQAEQAGTWGSATTLVSGAGSVANKWYMYKGDQSRTRTDDWWANA